MMWHKAYPFIRDEKGNNICQIITETSFVPVRPFTQEEIGGVINKIVAAPKLIEALGPSGGGTASFPDELDVVAKIIDVHDPSSGLGRHLRERAARIREALAKAEGQK